MPSALVIQGGGFRIAFTAGVLDSFIVNDYEPFDILVGVSAGSIAQSYFLSRQYGMMFESMKLLARDEHFMKFTRSMSREGFMDIDYVRAVAEQSIPFDREEALKNLGDRVCRFVATDKESGEPVYLNPCRDSWVDKVIASSTLPFFTKGTHTLEERTLFDGGWSDPLPVRWAAEQGADRILVIQCVPPTLRLKPSWVDYFGSFYFRSNPRLSACFSDSYTSYNESQEFISNPPEGIQIDAIHPSTPLKSGTFTYSITNITTDYRYGLQCGLDFLAKKKFK